MENFYLESDEELFSVIDRIKKSKSENITLVVPSGLSALRSIINLRILKEEAVSLGKDISIVTSDSLIKKLAQQSGLRVLDREPSEKEDRWPEELIEGGEIRPTSMRDEPQHKAEESNKRIISDIVMPKKKVEKPVEPVREVEEKEEELVKREEIFEEPVYKPEKIKPSFRFFTKKRITLAFIIFFLIAFGFVVYFVLPRAQIVINPKKESIRFETEVIADKDVDSVRVSDNTIPAQVFQLEMEESKKFPTTGEKEVEEKAKGKITVYNQYSSSDQTLVKTTRFLSEEGKLFRLVETTVIPGAEIVEGKIVASTKEVEVIADEPGEGYNIGPSNFTIPGFKGSPKYTGFYGKSTESMSGGAKGKMRVATKDDIEGGLDIVSLELKEKAREEFNKKIPEELKLLEDSQVFEVIESGSTLKADEPGKEFVATVKVRAWGLAFKEDDILYLIKKNISDKISENKTLLASTIQVDYKGTEIDLAGGKANFSVQAGAEAAWKLDQKKLKNNLAGKKEIEVRKYLSSLSEIEGAKVVFWPFWVKKIPKSKGKIKILIEAE